MACTAAVADFPPPLPAPPKDRLLPSPAPLVLHSATGRRDWGGKKPGRASSSSSWIEDKLLARASPTSRPPQDVPGRASLSENRNKDKAERHESVVAERAGRSPSREDCKKRSPSRQPSADRSDKKAKVEPEADPAAYYAGPAFIKSPDPSELPIPSFVKKMKQSD